MCIHSGIDDFICKRELLNDREFYKRVSIAINWCKNEYNTSKFINFNKNIDKLLLDY